MTKPWRISVCILLLALSLVLPGGAARGRASVQWLTPVEITLGAVDGPYVFYTPQGLEIVRVMPHGAGFGIEKRRIAGNVVPALNCRAQDGREFTFSLGKSLPPADTWSQPVRMIVTSDLHGDFTSLVRLLRGNGVVNDKLDWRFAAGHLVVIGDLFDRGSDSLPCIWLLYKLTHQAARQGGAVHLLLGNHDELTLRGQSGSETPAKYLQLAKALGLSYGDLWGSESEIGRFLRTRNAAERIGDTLFVHGGLSADLLQRFPDVGTLNRVIRLGLGSPKEAWSTVHPDYTAIVDRGGALWYRGYWMARPPDYAQATAEEIQRVLQHFQVQRVVVGHTEHDDITPASDGRIIGVDVPLPGSGQTGLIHALWLEGGRICICDEKGTKTPLTIQ